MGKNHINELCTFLKAMADPLRLEILRLLQEGEHSPTAAMNVSTLAKVLGISQPTVSHHLRILRQAGIVGFRKERRDCYYLVKTDVIRTNAERLIDTFRPRKTPRF